MLRSLILVAAIALSGGAQAEALFSYYAHISPEDRFSSRGQRLTDMGAILQQDRANVHRFGKADRGDERDPFFGNRQNRSMIPKLFQDGRNAGAYWDGIAQGDFGMDVLVQVCGRNGMITHLRVDPADGDGYGDC